MKFLKKSSFFEKLDLFKWLFVSLPRLNGIPDFYEILLINKTRMEKYYRPC